MEVQPAISIPVGGDGDADLESGVHGEGGCQGSAGKPPLLRGTVLPGKSCFTFRAFDVHLFTLLLPIVGVFQVNIIKKSI